MRHAYDTPPPLRRAAPAGTAAGRAGGGKVAREAPRRPLRVGGRVCGGAAPPRPPRPTSQAATQPVAAAPAHPALPAGWALAGALLLAGSLHRDRASPARDTRLDASLYLVLPFRHRDGSAPLLLNGDQCESLLHDALARWRGVQMVDPLWVADARSRQGGAMRRRGRGRDRSRAASRAGWSWARCGSSRTRSTCEGCCTTPRGDRLVREHAIRIAPDLSDAQARFQELADSLLVGGGARRSTARGGGQAVASRLARLPGRLLALQRWDLDPPRPGSSRRSRIDPTYGMAQLWLAQVLAWAGEEPGVWKSMQRARSHRATAWHRGTARWARAAGAAANGDYPEACEQVPRAHCPRLARLRRLVRVGRLPGKGSAGGEGLGEALGLALPGEL